MKRYAAPLIAVLATLLAPPLRASDHLDGPATSKERVTDLSDLYAFPTPGAPGFLTIILDLYPVVAATGHFSDRVSYAIHVRRAAIRAGDRPAFDTSDEVTLRCTFVTPHDDAAHTATCTTEIGVGATVKNDQVLPQSDGDGLHLFAGHRADPFFFNPVFAAAFSRGKLIAPRDQDIMTGTNTLTIVLDVEVKKLFPNDPPSLLALSAESITQDSPDAPARRLDRLGRPEISNIALVSADDEADLRDTYNQEPPFAVAADHAPAYRERIARNLALFDRVDGRTDWTDEDRLALTDLLIEDFLVVDVTRPCDRSTYFEIERSLLTHTQHQTCGGRRPTDDVMDTLFGLFAGGLGGAPIRDGVDHPSQPLSDHFPYLAAPNVSPEATVKATLLDKSGSGSGSGCGCGVEREGETRGDAALAALILGVAMRTKRRPRRGDPATSARAGLLAPERNHR